jgi:hypothetical protein
MDHRRDRHGMPFGVPVTASGTSTATSVSVSVSVPPFTSAFVLPPTVSGFPYHVKLTLGGAAHLTASPSMAAPTGGVPGTVIVMSAVHLNKGVNASMYVPGAQSVFHVPLDVGGNGHTSYVGTAFGNPITVNADFLGWTLHTRTFTGLSSHSLAAPDVVAMGSFNLTAMGGGSVQLVAPIRISVDSTERYFHHNSVALTTLKLSFVPEPSALLLFGAAVAALVLARASRRR